MSRYPKLEVTALPGRAEPKVAGQFLRVESDREIVHEDSHTVWTVTLLDKVPNSTVNRIVFLSTALPMQELMILLRDFRWSYQCIYMTEESAKDLLPLFLRPTVPIDVGDYTPLGSVSEFKSTLILD